MVGLISLLLLPKGEVVLSLDAHSTKGLDIFFLIITKAGEITGASVLFVILVFLAEKKYRIIFPLSVILMLFISQGLKHFVYADEHRPNYTYKSLHYIDGLERHSNNSFPSGHTTAAFTYFTLLALAFNKRYIQVLAPLVAALVGLSRVYLGQHYLHDVVAGAILGTVIATLVTYLYSRYLIKKED
jgi:membrane-associated phospholipid phosphatase